MDFYPSNWKQNLNFDRLLKELAKHCLSPLGKESLQSQSILTTREEIIAEFQLVEEMIFLQNENLPIPLYSFSPIAPIAKSLEPEGVVLSEEEIGRIRKSSQSVAKLFNFLKKQKEQCPALFEHTLQVPFEIEVEKSINVILDDKDEVKSNASPELVKIRTALNKQRKLIESAFSRIFKSLKKQGYLSELGESVRANRRVISLKAEHKRQVKGIIHDSSDSGKTVFIEPEEIVQLNNDLFELIGDEKREIYRILKSLCSALRVYRQDFVAWDAYLGKLDLLHAKAKFADEIDGVCPEIQNDTGFLLKNARHPLLFIQNQVAQKPTIPFDLSLHKGARILVISGPNAGGKSVCLKTMGLFAAMVHYGLPLSVEKGSSISTFSQLLIDIGDAQSIEDELSTYSSKLAHMKNFMEKADKRSLILIDEFGSGTDPNLGGAVAEACLEKLRQSQAICIVTTHYKNLKLFADENEGVINGSMAFNSKALMPLYHLEVGRPGSSFTFAIAERNQLPKRFITEAQSLVDQKDIRLESMLAELQEQKEQLESKIASLQEKAQSTDAKARKYASLMGQLKEEQSKNQQSKKEIELEIVERLEKRFQRMVERWKKSQEKQKAQTEKEVKSELKQHKQKTIRERKKLVKRLDFRRKEGKIKVGSWVSMADSQQSWQVLKIEKDKAEVAIGQINMKIKIDELFLVEKLEPQRRAKKGKSRIDKLSEFNNLLDLRGQRKEEAQSQLEKFIDEALVLNIDAVKILHGRGSGQLRKMVLNYAKSHKQIKEFRHEEEQAGGDGVTIIAL